MPFASSNRAALRYIEEVSFGTTPASPTFTPIRYTGESLNYNLSNVTSEEINDQRMTADLVQTQSDASGDISFELSYGTFDDFIEGAMASSWGTTVSISASDIDASDADNSFNRAAGSFVTDGIVVGQWIKVAGFTTAANNGYFRVATVAAAKITVYATLVTEASGDSITITGTMIRNGTTLKSYTIQKFLQDATTPTYFNFNGVRIGGLNLDLSVGSILTGSFSLMGLGATVSESAISGQSVSAASSTGVMNAVSNVSGVYFDNSASTIAFNSLSLALNNALRAQDKIGSLPHVGITLGRLDLTGNLSMYFEDKTMYDKYLNGTAFSIAFVLEDASGNSYVFTMPNVKFESGTIAAGGLDSDMMFDASWRAIKDSTTNCMIQIDKM